MQMRYAGAVCATESWDGFVCSTDPSGYGAFKILIGWRYNRASKRSDRQQVIDVPPPGSISAIQDIDVAVDSLESAGSTC